MPKVLATLDHDDALLVGATLRCLARTNSSPDPTVGERLRRVGNELTIAARSAAVVDLAERTGRVRGQGGVL